MKIKFTAKNIFIIGIVIICIIALLFTIIYQIYKNQNKKVIYNENPNEIEFDNQIILGDTSNTGSITKLDNKKELVYNAYEFNEISNGKYEINVNLPFININNENAININKEIIAIFYDKITSIINSYKYEETSEEKKPKDKTLYTITYSSYLNENIISLAIKATLKEEENAQRVIYKCYNYDISANKEISLQDALGVKGISKTDVQEQIKEKIEEAIKYSENLAAIRT